MKWRTTKNLELLRGQTLIVRKNLAVSSQWVKILNFLSNFLNLNIQIEKGFSWQILKAILNSGYKQPTPIQRKVIQIQIFNFKNF